MVDINRDMAGRFMKTVYLIGGTMGIGKTSVCLELKKKLKNAIFLDGDWCWDADPFQVTEETKKMVMENICFLLNQFIHCSAYENIVFCWVMHEQYIIDDIVAKLDLAHCVPKVISLIISVEALTARLTRDIENGVRGEDIIERSIAYLPLYEKLDTVKLDVSNLSPQETANEIVTL